jgi:hypothetical protein
LIYQFIREARNCERQNEPISSTCLPVLDHVEALITGEALLGTSQRIARPDIAVDDLDKNLKRKGLSSPSAFQNRNQRDRSAFAVRTPHPNIPDTVQPIALLPAPMWEQLD